MSLPGGNSPGPRKLKVVPVAQLVGRATPEGPNGERTQVRILPGIICRCSVVTRRCSFRSGCCSHWRRGGSQPLRGPSGRLWPGSLGGVKRRCLVDCRKANCTEDGGSTPPPTLGAIPPPTTQETTNSWPLVSVFGNRCSCSRRAQKSRAGVPALEMQCDGARLAVTQQVGVRFPPSP